MQYQCNVSSSDRGRNEDAEPAGIYQHLQRLEGFPDYLLRDELEENEVTAIREIEELWEEVPPSRQALVLEMIKAALTHNEQ